MREYPHPEDLGLHPEADQTEDMRKAPVAPEALQEIHPPSSKQGDLL